VYIGKRDSSFLINRAACYENGPKVVSLVFKLIIEFE